MEQSSGINGILITVTDKIVGVIEWFLNLIPTSLKETLNNVYESTKAKVKDLFGLQNTDYDAQKTQRELEDKLERKKREKLEKMQQKDDTKSYEMLNDFISSADNYIKRGDEIKRFSKDDNIIGFKKGNEIDKSITAVIKYLENVAKNGEEYIKIAKEQVNMLQSLIEKNNSNIISSNVNTNNYVLGSSSNVQSFRAGALT